MITEVHFQNYKLLRDVRLELGRMNVIVGRNGVGKSSALEGLHLLLRLAAPQVGEDRSPEGRLGIIFSGPHALRRLLSKPDAREMMLSAEFGRAWSLGITGAAPEAGPSTVRVWKADADIAHPEPVPPGTYALHGILDGLPAAGVRPAVRLSLGAEHLCADHYAEADLPQIAHNGDGLASVLQYLQGLRDGTLEQIEAALSEVVPEARRIRALPVRMPQRELVRLAVNGQETVTQQLREVTGARFEVEMLGAGWIPADQLSEGTLLALGLLTVVHARPPGLLLLDDLDKALHPVAQQRLIGLLRGILARQPELQILSTSHSPFVLDALEPEEVFVAGPAGSAASHIRRLDAHPGWAQRSGYMRPGEFWSFAGEGWVAEPAP